MTVGRFDIAEFVGDAFRGERVDRQTLIDLAEDRGARPAVLQVLRRLPARDYRELDDLWAALPDLPDAVDLWTPPDAHDS